MSSPKPLRTPSESGCTRRHSPRSAASNTSSPGSRTRLAIAHASAHSSQECQWRMWSNNAAAPTKRSAAMTTFSSITSLKEAWQALPLPLSRIFNTWIFSTRTPVGAETARTKAFFVDEQELCFVQLLKGVFLSSLAFAPHPFALRNNRFISITAFLLALWGVNAVGQTEAAGTGNHGDVRATIRQLVRSEQTSAARQAEAAEQPSSSVQDQARKQPLIRIIPYGRNNGANKGVGSGPKTLAPVAPHLTYWGGPVMSNIQVVAVFWGPNVAAAVTGNGAIDQFYIDITSSQYFDALTEYYTAGITGPNGTSTSNQTMGHGTFAGKFTITPSLCPGTAACTISDAQIQAELTNQVNNHVLPAPQTDAQGNINTYYAIYFPPNVTIALAPGVNSCVQGGFCAYHANTGSLLPYGVFPDFSAGGCSVQGACGSGTTLQKA